MSAKPLPPNEELRRLFRLDEKTGKLYWRARSDRSPLWNSRMAGKEAGTVRLYPCKKTYCRIRIRPYGEHAAHRIVFALIHGGCPADLAVDHINGNGLDNRPCNLRLATHRDNAKNRKKLARGVSWNRERNTWVARVCANNERHFLGYFKSRDEAQAAAHAGMLKHHGVFSTPTAKAIAREQIELQAVIDAGRVVDPREAAA